MISIIGLVSIHYFYDMVFFILIATIHAMTDRMNRYEHYSPTVAVHIHSPV